MNISNKSQTEKCLCCSLFKQTNLQGNTINICLTCYLKLVKNVDKTFLFFYLKKKP